MSQIILKNKQPQINAYLVGGAVRDFLLDRAVVERDYVVVGSTPKQMLALGFTPVGKDFPVFLHPQSKEEYALARTERKQGQGYTGFVCYAAPDVTLEQDLLRRDLTINAMVMTENGEIVDPYNGQQDLSNRLLRHVSDAFVEDPLRVLRVARFAARYHSYGFTVALDTLQLMQQIAHSGELKTLTPERIWKEMQRSLDEHNPQIFFEVLRKADALRQIWPELDKLWGVPNPQKWHPEICSGIHTMMVLTQAAKLSTKNTVRFAALCHDLGKGLTASDKYPSHKGHEKTGLPLVEKICQHLKVPTNHKRLALKVCEFHLHSHKAFELKASTVLNLFNHLDIWRRGDDFEDFLVACEADFRGRLGFAERDYPQADYLRSAAKAAAGISAKAFVEQGLKGPAIKEAMNNARRIAIAQVKQADSNNLV
jgi:tRNA nucleotidyltransferase (CCA-adding enzyme)